MLDGVFLRRRSRAGVANTLLVSLTNTAGFPPNHPVIVEVRLGSGEVYRLQGMVKRYKYGGWFVKLPPEAEAIFRERGLRVRISV